MSESWAQETDEHGNYNRLCRLLYDGGTLAVKTIFDGMVPPVFLEVVLRNNKHTLQRLKKPVGRVLSEDQWDLLYPPGGAIPKSDDFDITLLFVLLRNICGLKKPKTGWDALPPPSDKSPEANLVRIKYYRNKVAAHCPRAVVDDTQFQVYWIDISDALVSLGMKRDDINSLLREQMGLWDSIKNKITKQLEDRLEEFLEEHGDDILEKLDNIEENIDSITEKCALAVDFAEKIAERIGKKVD